MDRRATSLCRPANIGMAPQVTPSLLGTHLYAAQHTLHSIRCIAYLLGDSCLDMPGQMQTAQQGEFTSMSTHAYNSQKI